MATSGASDYSPPIGRMAITAFGRCQVRRTELTASHMETVYDECNLLQSGWGADGITWWTVGKQDVTLTAGVGTYTVLPNVVSVLDVYVSPGGGTIGQNRLLSPFSRTDYASLGNPSQQAFPTSFWWDRIIPSTLTLWPVPDNSTTYLMTYYYYAQIQDAVLRNGGNAQVPFFWLDAYVADLAHRLSRHYAPALEAVRKIDKTEAYDRACRQVETSPLFVTPGLSGYFFG